MIGTVFAVCCTTFRTPGNVRRCVLRFTKVTTTVLHLSKICDVYRPVTHVSYQVA